MLESSVLVLNRSYFPVNITSVRRAFILLYQGFAQVVTPDHVLFDFKSWSELSVEINDEAVGLVNRLIKVPRVILLSQYDRIPRRHIRFSRFNIYLRDNNTCQYCGRAFPRYELNLDHVVPRSLGGKSSWNNVVCSCLECNRRKGGLTPEAAGMRLLRAPEKPKWNPLLTVAKRIYREEWAPFLNVADVSYWNVELLQD